MSRWRVAFNIFVALYCSLALIALGFAGVALYKKATAPNMTPEFAAELRTVNSKGAWYRVTHSNNLQWDNVTFNLKTMRYYSGGTVRTNDEFFVFTSAHYPTYLIEASANKTSLWRDSFNPQCTNLLAVCAEDLGIPGVPPRREPLQQAWRAEYRLNVTGI